MLADKHLETKEQYSNCMSRWRNFYQLQSIRRNQSSGCFLMNILKSKNNTAIACQIKYQCSNRMSRWRNFYQLQSIWRNQSSGCFLGFKSKNNASIPGQDEEETDISTANTPQQQKGNTKSPARKHPLLPFTGENRLTYTVVRKKWAMPK